VVQQLNPRPNPWDQVGPAVAQAVNLFAQARQAEKAKQTTRLQDLQEELLQGSSDDNERRFAQIETMSEKARKRMYGKDFDVDKARSALADLAPSSKVQQDAANLDATTTSTEIARKGQARKEKVEGRGDLESMKNVRETWEVVDPLTGEKRIPTAEEIDIVFNGSPERRMEFLQTLDTETNPQMKEIESLAQTLIADGVDPLVAVDRATDAILYAPLKAQKQKLDAGELTIEGQRLLNEQRRLQIEIGQMERAILQSGGKSNLTSSTEETLYSDIAITKRDTLAAVIGSTEVLEQAIDKNGVAQMVVGDWIGSGTHLTPTKAKSRRAKAGEPALMDAGFLLAFMNPFDPANMSYLAANGIDMPIASADFGSVPNTTQMWEMYERKLGRKLLSITQPPTKAGGKETILKRDDFLALLANAHQSVKARLQQLGKLPGKTDVSLKTGALAPGTADTGAPVSEQDAVSQQLGALGKFMQTSQEEIAKLETAIENLDKDIDIADQPAIGADDEVPDGFNVVEDIPF
jgi:hypothetical protein